MKDEDEGAQRGGVCAHTSGRLKRGRKCEKCVKCVRNKPFGHLHSVPNQAPTPLKYSTVLFRTISCQASGIRYSYRLSAISYQPARIRQATRMRPGDDSRTSICSMRFDG